MQKGPKNTESKNTPERHETDETLVEQPLVNEENQKKIVNKQDGLSESNSRERDLETGEKISAFE